jgi:F-type H+-transporting ATPase subunit a
MMLAAENLGERLMEHVSDHPWEGWQVELLGLRVTLMSSAIASMLLVAVVLTTVLIPLCRRHRFIPSGGSNAVELLVVFVRDMVARPALGERASRFLPVLLTMFVFILGCNLIGLLPLQPVSVALGLGRTPVGVTPTSVLTVCAGLATAAFGLIIVFGLRTQALAARERRGWPMPLCLALSPLLWLKSLSPEVPGLVGKLLAAPLAALEFLGAIMKCFALMIRLFANMIAGHALLAILMLFILQALAALLRERAADLFYIAPACILTSVGVDLLELLVAVLQAYIFTFLTAMFLSLYGEEAHA